MSGASLNVAYSSLMKRITFCRSIYVKKVMKLFAFVFEHPSYNIGFKLFCNREQGILEPVFYDDLVNKFKRIVGKPNFSDQFKKIIKRYEKKRYNMDIMRRFVCLVVNPITIYSYGLLQLHDSGPPSDSIMVLT